MARNNVFWNQLLMRSDSISDIDPRAADAAEKVLEQLATVTEQFDRVFDPADQFEEYVAVSFCHALQRALAPQTAARVCRVAVQSTASSVAPAVNPPAVGPESNEIKRAAAKKPARPAGKQKDASPKAAKKKPAGEAGTRRKKNR